MKWLDGLVYSIGEGVQFFLILLFCSLAATASSQSYGLEFYGHEVPKDERTELGLSPDRDFSLGNEFEFSFDFSLIPNRRFTYGYIFRMIIGDTLNIDFLYTPVNRNQTKNFHLIVGHEKTNIAFNIDPKELINRWNRFRFKISRLDNKLILYTGDKSFTEVQQTLNWENRSLKIVMGTCDYPHFKTRDVPPMRIKDIMIHSDGKLRHHWPLNEDEGDYATDLIRKKKASIKKPSWIKPKHHKWSNIFREKINGHAQVAVNLAEERLYLIGEDQIIDYSIKTHSHEVIPYQNRPFLKPGWQAVYEPNEKLIYSFDIDNQGVAVFDFEDRRWKQVKPESKARTAYWHYNKYLSPTDTSFYIFGGYGQHEYKNEVQRYDPQSDSWNILESSGDFFNPRYLAASGALNDSVYILGGYGSPSREQILGPKNYVDLMAFSTTTHEFVKKFDVKLPFEDMSFANSLAIDPNNRSYFALAFPTLDYNGNLQLIRGSLDDPSAELVGDELPYLFKDTESFADLFYFPYSQKLITFTAYSDQTPQTEINLFSIRFPPNSIDYEVGVEKSGLLGYIALFIGIILVGAGVRILIFRKRKSDLHVELDQTATAKVASPVNENGLLTEDEHTIGASPRKNAVLFFGGFQVFNGKGEELTMKFTPLLKELFLLIWLSTLKNNKGISSEKLAEILWFGKSNSSARNNRAVNIAKLKPVLAEIGQCEITQKTGYWKAIFEPTEVYNDYFDFLKIINSKHNLTEEKVLRLIEITKQGPFLFNLNYEWLDEYKASISEKIIDTLLSFTKTLHLKKDANLIIQIAEAIFNFDSINEKAMVLKCNALIELGMHSLSKGTYQKFSKEYKTLYDEEYERSFVDVANRKMPNFTS